MMVDRAGQHVVKRVLAFTVILRHWTEFMTKIYGPCCLFIRHRLFSQRHQLRPLEAMVEQSDFQRK